MSPSAFSNRAPRWMVVACALTMAAGALAVLIGYESVRASAVGDLTVDGKDRPLAVETTPSGPLERPTSSVGAAVERAAAPTLDGASARVVSGDSSSLDEPESAQADSVVVPDFAGMRLSSARRRARALGLRLVARDSYGESIVPEDARWYRVSRQAVRTGTAVAIGASIAVRVRDASTSYGSGY